MARVQVEGTTPAGDPRYRVTDDDERRLEPVNDYLAYLTAIERSPNTIRAYAHDLKVFLTFLTCRGVDIAEVDIEDLAYFVQYLRWGQLENVTTIAGAAPQRAEQTVNRMMSAVAGLYGFLAECRGVDTADRLCRQARLARRPLTTVVDGIGSAPKRTRAVIGPRLLPKPRPVRLLSVQEARTIIGACDRARDRLFFTLLFTTGMRRGQALGLRHEDFDVPARVVRIVPRDGNENGARAKTRVERAVPITHEVARLYLDYHHDECADTVSDYIFVNLWAGQRGRAWSESTVDALVARLRVRTGIEGWTCHSFRHTFATLHQQAGMRIEVISHLLTHADIRTTAETYTHLNPDDLREHLMRAGCWDAA